MFEIRAKNFLLNSLLLKINFERMVFGRTTDPCRMEHLPSNFGHKQNFISGQLYENIDRGAFSRNFKWPLSHY
jgi:hypothetical protein